MKLKEGFINRQLAGQHIVVPVGGNIADFNGVITLNETGAFLWEQLQKGAKVEEMTAALLSEYDVSSEEAEKDVAEFVELLRERGLLLDD